MDARVEPRRGLSGQAVRPTRLILVGGAIAIVVGCTTETPPSQVTPLELWSEPETQLVTPGSEVLTVA